MKENEFGTLENLANQVQNDLKRVGRHVYNIQHQYRAIRKLRESLGDKEAIVYMDFSENYSCKCRSEIQRMHFGASQRQISLRTGMIYYRYTSQSFTTLSDNMYHGPAAIWAHSKPILRGIAEINNIERIHFVSDGPTPQYRSKNNFFLLSKIIFEFGFKSATWNFWEAGHGKGAPDGIDSLVLHDKQDITKAAELLEGLTKLGTKIDLYEIEQTEIDLFNFYKDAKITTVPETIKIHQEIYFNFAINTVLLKVNEVDESLIGRYCVVEYDRLPYPGIILDVDEVDLEVKVMHRIGVNNFFWPLLEYRLWYEKSKVVALLSGEPEHVTKRHCQIDQVVWKAITDEMDNE
ncbi:hypothetical protein MAR_024509 [Mya arenaria]|uniref:Uncharacterized protein n=1 Tax=Mya arenaria TaxID=6604 RepID=A0ABY7DTH6_MYAAR|nr:hypothetical protein MAR_024509 [Mya arenaria]